MAGHVYFIGAGPGDIELLTIKARNILEKADVIIYADSLVNPDICKYARAGTEIHGSSSLTLEEVIKLILDAVKKDKTVARLHSGDPAIYGAIAEQMDWLDQKGVEYTVIPGVSSLFASAAALKAELTFPGISQTVIVTRVEGNTPVPSGESLKSLAEHGATMAIFLSISRIDEVAHELLAGGYKPGTPAAVVYRASWQDQQVLRTTLKDLVNIVQSSGIKKQALILVGDFLRADKKERSKLYDGKFGHGYRQKTE
jgi:precorrin-4/cobalt-precorrin-4 C11-methyltransferase